MCPNRHREPQKDRLGNLSQMPSRHAGYLGRRTLATEKDGGQEDKSRSDTWALPANRFGAVYGTGSERHTGGNERHETHLALLPRCIPT